MVILNLSVSNQKETANSPYLATEYINLLNTRDMSPNRKTVFLSQEKYDQIKSQYAKFNEPWQTDEVEELKAMAADKVPIKDISSQLQRTPSSIKMKLKSLGLYTPPTPPRPWAPEEDKELIDLYNDNRPFEEIAEHFNRTVSAIVSRLVRLRINIFQSQQ